MIRLFGTLLNMKFKVFSSLHWMFSLSFLFIFTQWSIFAPQFFYLPSPPPCYAYKLLLWETLTQCFFVSYTHICRPSSLHWCFLAFKVIFTPLEYVPTMSERLHFFGSEYTINVYNMDFCTSTYSEDTGKTLLPLTLKAYYF